MNSEQTALPVVRVFSALAFLLFSSIAAAEAGRVMYVSGEATLVRGNAIPITKGVAVEAGDLIRTGADGRVQLLMADGDRIALRPSSEFRIDEFSGPSRSKPGEAVAGARPSSWRSFYTLAKGGFRTLTQSLGERDPSSYQVRTPVATIGIRGTDYTVLYCTDDCAAYKTASLGTSPGVRVQGMQASVFREGAGSRLLFAALGNSWVADFVKAQTLGGTGSGEGGGSLFGGVSKGEINVDGAGGNKSVKDNEFFQATNTGFEYLPEMPEGLQDQKEPEGETTYQEQVGDTETAEGEGGTTEGETAEGESTGEGESADAGTGEEGEGDAFSARTNPLDGEGTGDAEGGDGTTADGGAILDPTADPSDPSSDSSPPAQTVEATDPGGGTIDLTSGADPVPPDTRGFAFVGSPANGAYVPVGTVNLDSNGNVIGFNPPGGVAHAIGSGTNTNVGSALGMQWGRWTGGTAEIGGQPVDLSQGSVHWIYGPTVGSPSDVALPVSGSAYYDLTAASGNTDPTDNHGNVGFLGFASFQADFTDGTGNISNMQLGLSIADQVWTAGGNCASCINSDGSFGGSFQNVNCTGASCQGPEGGAFAGFFTPGNPGGPPPGAGMTYSVGDDNTTVSGAAALENTPPP